MGKKFSNTLKNKHVGIIDYGFGNVASVQNALNFLNIKNTIINNPKKINKFSHFILPGDGFFPKAVEVIRKKKWDILLEDAIEDKKKILGICVGMQLLLAYSYEGEGAKGLNFFNGTINKFLIKKNYSLPHVGFNFVKFRKSKLYEFDGYYYFIHSFRLKEIKEEKMSIGETVYSEKFISYFEKDNIYGTQFHPEKSGQKGLKFLKRFCLT